MNVPLGALLRQHQENKKEAGREILNPRTGLSNIKQMSNNPFSASWQRSMEARARRAAKAVGLQAVKSRNYYIANAGGFQLIDRYGDVQAGHEFDLTADDVIYFCRHWPEESKYALGASQHWPSYRRQSMPPDVLPPDVISIITTPQAQPLQLEMGSSIEPKPQVEISTSDAELEFYRNELGFPNGPKDLDLAPQPPWQFTFEEVYQEFAYKRVGSLTTLAEKLGYPPEAISKNRITEIGCQWLKDKRQKAREQQKEQSRQLTKKKKKKQKRRQIVGQIGDKSGTSQGQVRDKSGQIGTN